MLTNMHLGKYSQEVLVLFLEVGQEVLVLFLEVGQEKEPLRSIFLITLKRIFFNVMNASS